MKTLIALFFSLFFLFSSYAGEDIAHFRSNFLGIKDYETTETFLATKITEGNYSNAVTINSYKAVCKMMMAQYVYNPFTKYSWFNQGKALLEKTIRLDKNVENVYLRLIVQLNIPSFLGYTTEIKSDTEFILLNIEKANIPEEIKKYILKNLINTGEKEIESLKPLAEKYKAI